MTNALTIQNLTKTYHSGLQALKDISFSVAEGDFFALLGPNGAGKSTTIGIIGSLVRKTSGRVLIFEHDMDTALARAKSAIGLVPQEVNLDIFATVLTTVVLHAGFYGVPRRTALKRAEQYLSQLGLWEKRYDEARSLSGGMKRRLMIARALMHQPRLLILDEPTAGVDIELRRSLWQFLEEVNRQGTTIILTTHYLEEAETLCKNIAIINHGQVIANANKKTLLDKLHTETLILYLKTALIAEPIFPGFACRLLDAHTLEVEISKTQSLSFLFQYLAKQNIEVYSMRNKTNRLEELFLKLTQDPV